MQFYPDQLIIEEDSGAIKDLSQRRQKPAQLPSLSHLQQLLPSTASGSAAQKPNPFASDPSVSDRYDGLEYDKPLNQPTNSEGDADKGGNFEAYSPPSGEGPTENEFNLAMRRNWLQQQLGNTLQLLGFNSSTQSTAEFFNDTFISNRRENMMKMSSKLGKAVSFLDALGSKNTGDGAISLGEKLIPRQDDLKLEARVIGGSEDRKSVV